MASFFKSWLPKDNNGNINFRDSKFAVPASIVGGLALSGIIYKKFIKSSVPSDTNANHHYNVLIIGGSRGIGLYLAKHFILLGDNVIITSRSQNGIDSGINKLFSMIDSKKYGSNINGIICDITNNDSIESCFKQSNNIFWNNNNNNGSQIDIIINNAGIGYKNGRDYMWNIDSNDIKQVINVNLNGILICNQKAIQNYCDVNAIDYKNLSSNTSNNRTKNNSDNNNNNNNDKPVTNKGSPKQSLHIFNMCGAGSNGMTTPRTMAYGASKAPYVQCMKTINSEISNFKNDIGNIKMHLLQPGMVMTELMLAYPLSNVENNKDNKNNKPEPIIENLKSINVFNALLEEHDVVTQYLVSKVRAIKTKNLKCGQQVEWLTKSHAIYCIIGGLLFGKNKNKFVDQEGRPNPKYCA